MSLTIDSILNFNSCEVENGFFEPLVSNSIGVNLHETYLYGLNVFEMFQTPSE